MIWGNFVKWWLRRVTLALVAPALVTQVFAQTNDRFSVENERLYEVKLTSNYHVHDAILGYQVQSQLYLPFEEFGYALGFSISAFTEQGRVEGFLRNESESFELDLLRCEFRGKSHVTNGLLSKGHSCSLGVVFEGDVYVAASLLEEWLSLKIKEYPLKSLIVVESQKPIPIEERQIEERERKIALNRHAVDKESSLMATDDVISDWSGPFVDTNFYQSTKGSRGVNGFVGLNFRGFENTTRFSLSHGAPLDLTYTLAKRDAEGVVLLGLPVKQMYLYDIFIPDIEGISHSRAARGLYLSNRPVDFAGGLTTRGLRGVGEPGWNVELYSGSVLIGATQVDALGQYEFPQVSLNAGDNVFRVLMIGPQGQRRQEFRTFGISDMNPGKGKFHYFLYSARGLDGESESAFETRYGIADSLVWTSNVLLRHGPSEGVPSTVVLQGFESYFDVLSPSVAFALDSDFGYLAKPKLRFLFSESSLDLGYTRQKDFYSTYSRTRGVRESSHRYDLVGSTTISWPWPVGARLTAQWARSDVDLDWIQTSELSMSTYVLGLQLQNLLRLVGVTKKQISGTWQIQKLLSEVQLRLRGDYLSENLKALSVDVLWGSGPRQWGFRSSAGYAFSTHETTASLAVGKTFSRMELGVQASYTRSGGVSGVFSLSTNFGRNSDGGHWSQYSEPMADRSSIAVHSYVDKTQKPLSGVKVKLNQSRDMFVTDQSGRIFIPGVSPNTKQKLSVSSEALAAQNLIPTKDEFLIDTDPLKTHQISVVFAYAIDLEGTLRSSVSDGVSTKSYTVCLKDTDTGVVRKTKTEFDGYYIFEEVKAANYEIWVEARDARDVFEPGLDSIKIDGISAPKRKYDFLIKKAPLQAKCRKGDKCESLNVI